MIVTRNGVDWVVESPSLWVLCGEPRIRVEFSGVSWWRKLGMRVLRMKSKDAAVQSVEKLVNAGTWKQEA